MRLRPPLAALVIVVAFPAVANASASAALVGGETGIPDAAVTALWCGAAFRMAATEMTRSGDPAGADALFPKAERLLTRAATLLVAEGMARAEIGRIAKAYALLARSQTIDKTDPAAFTVDECEAAARG